jgi:hypothetical protein
MPTPTYTPMATVTLASSSSSVTFSNIPATPYRDIIVVGSIKGTSANEIRMRFNGNSSSIYNFVQMNGDGSTTLSNVGTTTGGWINPNYSISATDFNPIVINIMDFATTDKQKIYLSRFNNAANSTNLLGGRFASTSAITQIEFFTTSNALAIGSTLSLYGVI